MLCISVCIDLIDLTSKSSISSPLEYSSSDLFPSLLSSSSVNESLLSEVLFWFSTSLLIKKLSGSLLILRFLFFNSFLRSRPLVLLERFDFGVYFSIFALATALNSVPFDLELCHVGLKIPSDVTHVTTPSGDDTYTVIGKVKSVVFFGDNVLTEDS